MFKALRRGLLLCLLLPAIVVMAAAGQGGAAGAQGRVHVLHIQDIIGPATSAYIEQGLERAVRESARLVVIQIDTPGGLDPSMRSIVQAILASPVPVAGYVSPGGARAASAGTFILYASHVAAMTPASNLGAASPVAIGLGGASDPDKGADAPKTQEPAGKSSVMAAKVQNDAAAYLRSLAQLRGRNLEFAEAAVRTGSSLSAQEALEQGVIDVIAADLSSLLKEIDGRLVSLDGGSQVTLQLQGAEIVDDPPGWRTRVLSLLTNPQLAIVLMMIGVYGLFFELTSPGFGLPGVAGVICLLMGMVAFHMLPVNWGGVALLFTGTAMMVAEVFLPSFGALGLGGIIAFVLGGVLLTDTDIPGFDLSIPFLAGLGLATMLLLLLAATLAGRAHARKVVTGTQAMLGLDGRFIETRDGMDYALIRGEHWHIKSATPLQPGDRVRVTAVDGLTLTVQRLADTPDHTAAEEA